MARRRFQYKKLVIGIAGFFLLLYFAGGFYFSSKVIRFSTYSLEVDETRNDRKTYQQLGLPEPAVVSVPVGDGYLKGFLFTFNDVPRCAVLLQHGHKGTRYGMLKYMPLFKGRRCAMLSLDARYHGESVGDYGTYGYYEQHDFRKAYSWLKRRFRLPDNRIGLVGESMGAAIAMMAATTLTDIAFVIIDSPYAVMLDRLKEAGIQLYSKKIGEVPSKALMALLLPPAQMLAETRADFDLDDVNVAAAASKVKAPVLVIHSKQDAYTLPYHAEKVFEAISHDQKELHLTDWGAKHAKNINVNYEGYRQIVEGFLRRYAPGF